MILNKEEAEQRIHMIDIQLDRHIRDYDALKDRIPQLEAEKKLLLKLIETYKWEEQNGAKERNLKNSC